MEKRFISFLLLVSVGGTYAMRPHLASNTENYRVIRQGDVDSGQRDAVGTIGLLYEPLVSQNQDNQWQDVQEAHATKSVDGNDESADSVAAVSMMSTDAAIDRIIAALGIDSNSSEVNEVARRVGLCGPTGIVSDEVVDAIVRDFRKEGRQDQVHHLMPVEVSSSSRISFGVRDGQNGAEESKENAEAKEDNSRLAEEFNAHLFTVGERLILSYAQSDWQVTGTGINDLKALLIQGKTQGILSSKTCNKLLFEALQLVPWDERVMVNETYSSMWNRTFTQASGFVLNLFDGYGKLIELLIQHGASSGGLHGRDNNSVLQSLFMNKIMYDSLEKTSSYFDPGAEPGFILIPNPAVTPILDILCNVDFSIDHRNAHGLTLEDMIRKNTYTSPTDMSYVMGQHLSQLIAKKKLQKKEAFAEKQRSCAIS